MTTLINDCEGPDGGSITTSSSAAGSNQWTSVVKGTTGILEFDSDKKIVGNSSILCGSTANADRATVKWTAFAPTTTNRVSVRVYLYIPVGAGPVFSVMEALDTNVASVSVLTDGRINLTNPQGVITASAGLLEFSKWYRFELVVDQPSQLITLKVFEGHDTTEVAALGITATTLDAGAQLIAADRVLFGKYSTSRAAQFWMDQMQVVSDSTAFIGPISGAGVAHYDITGNYNSDSPALVSWTVNATSSVGTTTLVQLSGPAASIAESPTGVFNVVNPAAAGDIVLRLTATSGGATSTDILLERGSSDTVITDKPYRWTFQGGDASDIANWK